MIIETSNKTFQERSITKHCDSRGNSSGIFKSYKSDVFNKFQKYRVKIHTPKKCSDEH